MTRNKKKERKKEKGFRKKKRRGENGARRRKFRNFEGNERQSRESASKLADFSAPRRTAQLLRITNE